ncbi:mycothiol synthase [Streptomyces sp. M10(2022)]
MRIWAHGASPPPGTSRRSSASPSSANYASCGALEPAGHRRTGAAPDVTVRTFVPGQDDAAWLAANSSAFAHHPEQGGLTQRDLDDRKAEPWFDPEGFFLAEREGELIGFHWTKKHTEGDEPLGEVYVVGVLPEAQGGGLGKALTAIGLRHLAAEGLPTAMLYVDADNPAALAVYERMGFVTHEVDLMYRTES